MNRHSKLHVIFYFNYCNFIVRTTFRSVQTPNGQRHAENCAETTKTTKTVKNCPFQIAPSYHSPFYVFSKFNSEVLLQSCNTIHFQHDYIVVCSTICSAANYNVLFKISRIISELLIHFLHVQITNNKVLDINTF